MVLDLVYLWSTGKFDDEGFICVQKGINDESFDEFMAKYTIKAHELTFFQTLSCVECKI